MWVRNKRTGWLFVLNATRVVALVVIHPVVVGFAVPAICWRPR
jgi:hypothetical protein